MLHINIVGIYCIPLTKWKAGRGWTIIWFRSQALSPFFMLGSLKIQQGKKNLFMWNKLQSPLPPFVGLSRKLPCSISIKHFTFGVDRPATARLIYQTVLHAVTRLNLAQSSSPPEQQSAFFLMLWKYPCAKVILVWNYKLKQHLMYKEWILWATMATKRKKIQPMQETLT